MKDDEEYNHPFCISVDFKLSDAILVYFSNAYFFVWAKNKVGVINIADLLKEHQVPKLLQLQNKIVIKCQQDKIAPFEKLLIDSLIAFKIPFKRFVTRMLFRTLISLFSVFNDPSYHYRCQCANIYRYTNQIASRKSPSYLVDKKGKCAEV